jgi:RNA polymerase sigma factor (sigma-70 family)
VSPLFFKRLSDEILGSRLASGEAAAFDELYRRYANRLAAYGGHLLGDAGLGDDVAQATMLKAYGALREGRVPKRMKPWLFTIAHNAAIDLVVRRRELPSDDLPEAPVGEREAFAGTLVEALATLPDRQRRVYVLREVHGLRIDETAAELGLTSAQVEQSLFAARNRLAEQLVFGDRLNCVTVQRLAAGPLDTAERRALKTHLRTCNACRQTLGLRGRALSVFPSGLSLEWLARLGPGLIAGGAPAAAKVGAVVATATIAAGVPVVAVETARHHAHRPVVPRTITHAAPLVSLRPVAPVEVSAVATAASVSTTRTIEPGHSSLRGPATRANDHAKARDAHRGSADGEHKDGGATARVSGAESGSGGKDSGGDRSGDASTRGGASSKDGGSGSGDGGGTSPTGKRESGDRHGGDSRSTVTTPATGSGGDGELDGSHGGGDGSSGGGSGSGRHSGDGSHGGGGDSGGGDSSGGGGDTTTTPTLPTTTTSDLPLLNSGD